ncbi:MAG TPA: NHL repeat-containing protein [Candidatus Binataceae bacterium]
MHRPELWNAVRLLAAGFLMTLTILAALLTGAFARSGDTTADRELGQPDLFHNAPNTVDGNVFNQPNQLALDKSVTPYRLYIADGQNNRVLGYHSVAALVTGGYADLVVGQSDFYSSGCPFPGTPGSLCSPAGIAVDGAGNLFVTDSNNNRVLEFSNPFAVMKATGRTAGFQAGLVLGQPDFRANQCNRGAAVGAATLCTPIAAALDSHNNLFVADANNQRVLEYNAGFATAANANRVFGQLGSFTTNIANKGGVVNARTLDLSPQPHAGLAIDPNNSLFIADFNNHRVLKYNFPLSSDTANAVFGQAGKFTQNFCDNNNGPNANSLCGPFGVTVDRVGDVFIADSEANRVLEFKPPIAANPTANVVFGGSCSPLSSGTMCTPAGVAVDSSGNLYVDDLGNNRLLEFFPPFPAFPFASQILGQPDSIHNAPNSVDVEGMNNPTGVALDRSVTPNHLYVAEQSNHRILGFRNAASFRNNAPADIVIGQPDFYSPFCNQTGGPNRRTLCSPNGLAVDKLGNLFVADFSNSRVLEYSPPFSSGYTVNQPAFAVFGQGGLFTTGGCNSQNAGHTAVSTSLCNPSGVAISAATGRLYVVDQNNNRVLEFDPPFAANPVAAKVFGQSLFTANLCNRTAGSGGANQNTLCSPSGVAVDTAGNLYIADTANNRALEYNAPLVTGNYATLVFGQAGSFVLSGCNDVGLNSDSLCTPQGIGVDGAGNVYIADGTNGCCEPNVNNRVLEYNTPLRKTATPGSGDTTADRVFGQGGNFASFLCNLGGTAPSGNTLCYPWNVAFDSASNLYISDFFNNRVTEYDVPVPTPTPAPTAPPAVKTPTRTPTHTPTKAATRTPTHTATRTPTPKATP